MQVAEARETEVAINENRNQYRPVACRGAMLFFLLNSLNKIHAFYQFSLNAFVTVFSRGLDLAPGGRKKKEKVDLKQVCHLIAFLFAAACVVFNRCTPTTMSKHQSMLLSSGSRRGSFLLLHKDISQSFHRAALPCLHNVGLGGCFASRLH